MGVRMFWKIGGKHEWLNISGNVGGICRAAPATPGLLLKVINNINNRTPFFSSINGHKSNNEKNKAGCPQGSKLGPSLI